MPRVAAKLRETDGNALEWNLTEARHSWRRGDRVWSLYSAKSAAVSLLMFGAASAGFGQQPRLVDRAGLCQRIAVGTVFGWLTALSVRRLRATG